MKDLAHSSELSEEVEEGEKEEKEIEASDLLGKFQNSHIWTRLLEKRFTIIGETAFSNIPILKASC